MSIITSTHGGQVSYEVIRNERLEAGDMLYCGLTYDGWKCHERVISIVEVRDLGNMVEVTEMEDGATRTWVAGKRSEVNRVTVVHGLGH